MGCFDHQAGLPEPDAMVAEDASEDASEDAGVDAGDGALEACLPGYARQSGVCTDIDECLTDNGGCDPRATCTNAPGAWTCGPCPEGFTGTGDTVCTDIDECLIGNGGCDARTTCTNTAGDRACSACPGGFTGTGDTTCEDINECLSNNGGCDALTTCTNMTGGRTCSACPPGYTGTGDSRCMDINECATSNGRCDVFSLCMNTGGGRVCGPCPLGSPGTGDTQCNTSATYVDPASGREWQRVETPLQYWVDAMAYCDALVLEGKDDWRLPTRVEGISIIDYSTRYNPAFPPTNSNAFWTQTLRAGSPTAAWYVGHSSGRVGTADSMTKAHARCVRGPTATQPTNQFVAHADTVDDSATGLEWQRTIDATRREWTDAGPYCANLLLDGGGWRVPTMKELLSIVDETRYNPALDGSVFLGMPENGFFWSSQRDVLFPESRPEYWGLHFPTGSAAIASSGNYVRCVR